MPGNQFENSYLGNIIGTGQQQVSNVMNNKMNQVKQMGQQTTQKAKQLQVRKSQRDKSYARLRAKYGSMYDPDKVRQRQQELVNAGYKVAVDGDWGQKSELAWQNYQSKNNQPVQRKLTNMQAVTTYMPQTTGKYTVVDKASGKVYLYENGKLIGEDNATLGSFKGDGYTVTKDEKDWKNKARQTGAGIFTVRNITDMYGDKGIQLNTANGRITSEALHRNLGGGKDGDRKQGSGGCVRSDIVPQMARRGWYSKGDSVIVVPELQGNSIKFDQNSGKFYTNFTNMPQSVRHPGGYNEVKLQYNQADRPTQPIVWYDPTTWFN